MAKIKLTSHRRKVTPVPVTAPLPGRTDMVPNSTGGFAWQVTDWDQLDRFLILGTEGGSYYIGEQKLTEDNAKSVRRCIQADAQRTLDRIVEVSQRGLALRNEAALFALAMVATHAADEVKTKVPEALRSVARTGTHLLHWADYVNSMRGWGRMLRRAVGDWYLQQEANRLAFQAVKYQQRDGWSHRDMLRLAHPKAKSSETEAVFRWIQGGIKAVDGRDVSRKIGKETVTSHYESVASSLPMVIEAFEKAKAATKASEIVSLIAEHGLPREAIPTQWLDDVSVWEALLQKMPLTATIRNLGKMTSIGLLKPLSAASRLVAERLKDGAYLRKSRVHPLAVLVAAKTYGQGQGIKGKLRWTPVPAVQSALDEAFYGTFPNVQAIGKPLLLALDVSGSMGSSAAGTVLRACEATAAMSLVWLNTEPEIHVFGFGHTFRELGIRKGMTLEDAAKRAVQANFGSTDISLAIKYATQNKLEVGGFVVMTDNEGNTGEQPATALRAYRKSFVNDARLVVMATSANRYSVADPTDKYSLDVVGFDPSVPQIVNGFIRGEAGSPAATEDEDQAAE